MEIGGGEGKRRKVEETVIEVLKDDHNWEEATEHSVRRMAADRLAGLDTSDMDRKRLVRRLVESYLLPLDNEDDEEETKEIVPEQQDELEDNMAVAVVDLKEEMDFQADTCDTDFLDGGSNQGNEFEIDCSEQAGQSDNHLVCLSTESTETPCDTGQAKKRAQRSCNFTVEEDNLLVLTWLNVCLDLVYVEEPKRKTYWQRMYDYFHKHKSFPTDRSCTSLMNRWSTIQLAVNNFCECYAQIVARCETGASEIDKVLQAKIMYHKTHRAPFQFEHCWNKLRDQPKWSEFGQKKKAKKSKSASPCAFSPSPLQSLHLGEDSKQSDTVVESERPIGREAEKERLEKQNDKVQVDNSTAPAKERIDERRKIVEKKMELLQKTYAQELERLRLQRMQLEMEQQKDDERIMCIDTTGMPPLQAEYYRLRQKEILRKGRSDTLNDL